MEYKIKPAESSKEYQIRLCRNKDLYDLTWEEISSLWFEATGEKRSGDVFRKFWRYFNEGYEAALLDGTSSNEIINELEDKRIEFEQEKIRFQDQKREYMKYLREKARIDHIKDEMVKAVYSLNKTKPIQWSMPEYKSNKLRHGASLNSDWHKGLFASNHWNMFDDNEFYKRIDTLVTKTIEYGREQSIDTLHFFLLGDLINGLIHNITRITSSEDAVTHTMSCAETVAEMIAKYASEFNLVKIYNCRGNHERVTQNKKESIAKESFNDIIPWYLKARLSHIRNIEFVQNTIDDEIIVTDILGYKIFATHGDKDKVNNVVQNLTLMTRQFPDYVFMGHTHHHEENETHSVEVIVNSSFSGVDEYAKDIRKTSKASQKFIVFEEGKGRRCTYPIYLSI